MKQNTQSNGHGNSLPPGEPVQYGSHWNPDELQDYVENAPLGLHWVDRNGIIKWANSAELSMLGYTKDEYIGHHIAEFHADQNKINDILHRLACDQTLNSYESELRCKDGSTKTVQITSNVFRDEGKFIHTRCFTTDISEQKHLLRALQASEQRYRKLVESLPIATYTCNLEGRITFFNARAAELWGYTPDISDDTVRFCACYKVRLPDGTFVPPHQTPMAIALQTGQSFSNVDAVVERPDGSTFQACVNIEPFFDEMGQRVGAINIFQDVTALKETEQALRASEARHRELAASLERKMQEKTADLERKHLELIKSEERYHKMIEEVEDYAIIFLDSNGIILNWNKGAEKIKGYREDEIIGKSFSNFYLPEDRRDGLPDKLLRRAAEHRKAVHEGWRVRKDGSIFWGSVVLTALHGSDDSIIGFSKVTRDLTEIKFAEDKLREYTAQLEFQNKELEQFAYAASHDMKAPLRKIHLFNTAIADNPANKLDEESREFLNRSIAAVKRLDSLIENLLTYAKTTANEANFEQVDLNKIIDSVLMMHKEEFSQSDVTIESNQLPVVSAVPFQMEQLFSNLIHNSIKYKHPDRSGSIRIQATTVEGSAISAAQALPHRQYYQISVIDNGAGFEPQYGEKIFQIFQRLDNVPSAGGSGIGLAICKKIVQNHHGFITAKGEMSKGAVIDVYLPKGV